MKRGDVSSDNGWRLKNGAKTRWHRTTNNQHGPLAAHRVGLAAKPPGHGESEAKRARRGANRAPWCVPLMQRCSGLGRDEARDDRIVVAFVRPRFRYSTSKAAAREFLGSDRRLCGDSIRICAISEPAASA
ncbi:hypothetical protein THAR02_10868 [Trichoderma harzianum]|uniref:Uncharacterized protein n=1 Tax=Trichoderma harzianum TaxID=5544 RepID=A0A0F9WX63_TRIHA|nr:hypothetical protein THAR02_10868 [Trichoderma harzianum]